MSNDNYYKGEYYTEVEMKAWQKKCGELGKTVKDLEDRCLSLQNGRFNLVRNDRLNRLGEAFSFFRERFEEYRQTPNPDLYRVEVTGKSCEEDDLTVMHAKLIEFERLLVGFVKAYLNVGDLPPPSMPKALFAGDDKVKMEKMEDN